MVNPTTLTHRGQSNIEESQNFQLSFLGFLLVLYGIGLFASLVLPPILNQHSNQKIFNNSDAAVESLQNSQYSFQNSTEIPQHSPLENDMALKLKIYEQEVVNLEQSLTVSATIVSGLQKQEETRRHIAIAAESLLRLINQQKFEILDNVKLQNETAKIFQVLQGRLQLYDGRLIQNNHEQHVSKTFWTPVENIDQTLMIDDPHPKVEVGSKPLIPGVSGASDKPKENYSSSEPIQSTLGDKNVIKLDDTKKLETIRNDIMSGRVDYELVKADLTSIMNILNDEKNAHDSNFKKYDGLFKEAQRNGKSSATIASLQKKRLSFLQNGNKVEALRQQAENLRSHLFRVQRAEQGGTRRR